MSWVFGSRAYRMIRMRSDGAAGVYAAFSTYAWVVTSHVNVLPSRAGGTTLALMPLLKVVAMRCSAWSCVPPFRYGAATERGGTIGAARRSPPARVGAPTGEPDAKLSALKLWNVEDCNTPLTAWRSVLRPWASDR